MRALFIVALFAYVSATTFAVDDGKTVPSPFVTPYKAPSWGGVEISIFVLGVGTYWKGKGLWPQEIKEVREGVTLWIAGLKLSEKEKKDSEPIARIAEVIEIKEIIPMWHGVAYRVYYHRDDIAIGGLIVLSEADTADAIAKSARYSQDLGGIVYAVPF